MRSVVSFNDSWLFHEGFEPGFAAELRDGRPVSLPHNAVDLPFNYFDETSYQRAFTYQKVLRWQPDFEGREISCQDFTRRVVRMEHDGSMKILDNWNGKPFNSPNDLAPHPDGSIWFTDIPAGDDMSQGHPDTAAGGRGMHRIVSSRCDSDAAQWLYRGPVGR